MIKSWKLLVVQAPNHPEVTEYSSSCRKWIDYAREWYFLGRLAENRTRAVIEIHVVKTLQSRSVNDKWTRFIDAITIVAVFISTDPENYVLSSLSSKPASSTIRDLYRRDFVGPLLCWIQSVTKRGCVKDNLQVWLHVHKVKALWVHGNVETIAFIIHIFEDAHLDTYLSNAMPG